MRSNRFNDPSARYRLALYGSSMSHRIQIECFLRRAIDLSGAALGILVLGPVAAAISAAIKLDSDGPVLFRQTRVGIGGTTFELIKFRSMRERANVGPSVTAAGDPRVTRAGSFLRSTKLDELPQLINVLKGEMSLVGPRPEVPVYAAMWTASQRDAILSVRPGITDPVTLSLRHEEEMLSRAEDPQAFYTDVLLPAKAEAYAEYVRQRSLASDMCVLVHTLRAVLKLATAPTPQQLQLGGVLNA